MRQRLFLAFFLLATAASAQVPDSVQLLVDSALNVMEHRGFNSHKLDWPAIRGRVQQMTAGARTHRDAFPALAWAFDQLGDKHGWITVNDSSHHNQGVTRTKRSWSAGLDTALRKGPRLYNGVVAGRYAYISIHFFGRQTEADMNRYARQISDSLCKNIGPGTRGIIIDLRLNGGGNSHPMNQGLAAVYGNRVLSEGVNGRGERIGVFAIRGGRVTVHGNHGDSIVLAAPRGCGDLSRLPVAVLISPVTGSSAEQLAINFTSRPRTVLIGERTSGYVTANNGFLLPGTDNALVLAESLTRNVHGTLFSEEVRPDIEVTGGDDLFDRSKDLKIKAAVRWLDRQQRVRK
ncbi:S41 family peptidase [Flaviaesturariibacter amylovorans]|uniref:Tail specific protease domain-containing protein n=1 Tax=Flaviaesturariibacter amylovorans TaxID=1084520 RepID=A0ABP8HTD6_9BACT